jgi:cell division protein FtsL
MKDMEMSRTSTAFDYSRYCEPKEYKRPIMRTKPAASRSAVMIRRALVLFIAMATAAVCIGLVYMKAQVYKTQREVNEIQTQIKQAQRLNSSLNEQLNEAMNINAIMSRAERLGMTYPAEDQVLYVNRDEGKANIEMKNKN